MPGGSGFSTPVGSDMGLKRRLMRKITVAGLAMLLTLTGIGSAFALPRTDIFTDVGLLGLTVTNLGYVGNGYTSNRPSGEYPIYSNVEHIFFGGLWVGAVNAEGQRLVSTGAQDASALSAGEETREYNDLTEAAFPTRIWSNRQNADNFSVDALATQHIEFAFDDYRDDVDQPRAPGPEGHPAGPGLADPLRRRFRDPRLRHHQHLRHRAARRLRGLLERHHRRQHRAHQSLRSQRARRLELLRRRQRRLGGRRIGWRRSTRSTAIPKIWMMYEHDADGDEGLATSWIGAPAAGHDAGSSGPAADVAAGVLQRLAFPRRARAGRLVRPTRTTRHRSCPASTRS